MPKQNELMDKAEDIADQVDWRWISFICLCCARKFLCTCDMSYTATSPHFHTSSLPVEHVSCNDVYVLRTRVLCCCTAINQLFCRNGYSWVLCWSVFITFLDRLRIFRLFVNCENQHVIRLPPGFLVFQPCFHFQILICKKREIRVFCRRQ